jgi:hypothetical protein
MFVDDKAHIQIPIYYRFGKDRRGIRVESNLDKIPEEKRADYKTVTFAMRPMTWKMSNDLMRECRFKNPATLIDEIDWIVYKEKKLKMVIAGWDAKKDDGTPIPVNDVMIATMHPLIAETLLSLYDKESYLEEEERKN